MKTLKELYEFYADELLIDLKCLEYKRKIIIRNALIAEGAVVVGAIIAFTVSILLGGQLGHSTGIALLFLIIGIAIFEKIQIVWIDYKVEFKQWIICKIIRFLEPGLNYQVDGFIDQDRFKSSGLFNHLIDRYGGGDLVKGIVDKTQVAFSMVNAQYKTGSGEHKKWQTLFRGFFFTADSNKHLYGQTVILPRTDEKRFEHFEKPPQKNNVIWPNLIKLEDPRFEREFVVYGSDQIGPRYVLSTSLMQRILDFKKETGTKICLSFTGSRVCIAIPFYRNMFDPKYFSSATGYTLIAEYHRNLSFTVGIVDDLNLNTRIWTKE